MHNFLLHWISSMKEITAVICSFIVRDSCFPSNHKFFAQNLNLGLLLVWTSKMWCMLLPPLWLQLTWLAQTATFQFQAEDRNFYFCSVSPLPDRHSIKDTGVVVYPVYVLEMHWAGGVVWKLSCALPCGSLVGVTLAVIQMGDHGSP